MMHVQLWLNAVMLLAVFSYTECARILGVYGTGATSHKNIVTSVLKELASRGHQVTVITPLPENENRPNYTEISTEAQKEKVMEDSTGGKDMFQIGDIPSFPMMIFMWNVGQKFSEFTLKTEAVQKLLSDSTQHFDLVFVENFYSEAFLGFSHIFNAPIVTICTFSGTEEIGDSVGDPYPYSYVPTPYYDFTDHMTFYQRLQNTLLNVFVKLGRILYYLPKQEAIMRKYFTQKPNLPSITELDRSTSLVLLNTHFSFNFPRPRVPNLIEVGGLHIKRPNKLPQDLQTFLDNSPEGVVYFSMGSNLQSADMPIEKKLAFLNAFSRLKQKVLWKFEDKSLDNIPKNVKIQKWLPQSDLLAHPNIRVFMTHGGLLSTQEAIFNGVPLVGIPVFADQVINIKKAVMAGYAQSVSFKNITGENVYSALTEVITNHRYRDNAKRMSRLFHDQPETPMERAIFWVEYVIRHKGAKHMRSASLDLTWYQYYLLDVIGLLLFVVVLVLGSFLLLLRNIYRKLTGSSSKTVPKVKSSKKKN